MNDINTNVTPGVRRKRKLKVQFYKRRKSMRWSWRLLAANGVNWAGPDKGFFGLNEAIRSVDDMISALGGNPKDVTHQELDRKGRVNKTW